MLSFTCITQNHVRACEYALLNKGSQKERCNARNKTLLNNPIRKCGKSVLWPLNEAKIKLNIDTRTYYLKKNKTNAGGITSQ